MTTVYDWLTVSAFVALAVLYLQRSSMPDPPDKIWHYLPAGFLIALANYVGNDGNTIVAIIMLTVALIYTYHVIYKAA